MLNQARSDLAKQEIHVESLNKCIDELQRQTEEQRLALHDAQHGFVESRREQVQLQEELSLKEKVLRNTQIRNMHDMGEIKRAQEQRTDVVSVQKLRENHETIQRLTSQLQQDVESNCSERLSHVSSQPAMIPSSRALLSRDKRLPLDTWNQSGWPGGMGSSWRAHYRRWVTREGPEPACVQTPFRSGGIRRERRAK